MGNAVISRRPSTACSSPRSTLPTETPSPGPNSIYKLAWLKRLNADAAELYATGALRLWAGVVLALYAAAVFPANVKHAFYNVQAPGLPTSWWYHAPRLAFQPVLIWWALYSAQVLRLAVRPPASRAVAARVARRSVRRTTILGPLPALRSFADQARRQIFRRFRRHNVVAR